MDIMEGEDYTQDYRDYNEEEEELSPLNEGDEAVSLYDVLVERDKSLSEEELWALCRECCLVLEVVNNSPEMFQTLCVTPDTVAFDGAGNVCFLDLDRDPEALYIPPEYDNVGNSIKSHLFSLGMTLLYAAEYNGEPGQQLCTELQELFGCMTSEHLDARPDLESIITQCEEELCGKSSQEICCGIGGFAAPFTPAPDVSSEITYTDITEGVNNYLSSQTSIIPSVVSENNNEPQQHSTPSGSPSVTQGEPGSLDNPEEETEDLDPPDPEDMPMRGMLTGMPLPTGNRERKPQPRGSNKQTLNFSSNLISNLSNDKLSKDVNLNVSETMEETLSDSRLSDGDTKVTVTAEIKTSVSPDKPKPPLPKKPSIKEPQRAGSGSEGVDNVTSNDIKKTERMENSREFSLSTSKAAPVEAFAADPEPQSESVMDVSESASVKRTESSETSGSETKPKRSKKKQGLTVNEVLDSINRELTEEELWAVCREGTIALQRKKKHLPAYISPDTLVLRENGNFSFKAIPEDKPLEVIFMAPELQQKGKLSDKTCLYGLGVTLRCAGGKKYSPISAMSVSEEFQSLLEELVNSDPAQRPTLEAARLKCDSEGVNSLSSNITCKNLFQESFTKMMNLTNVDQKDQEAAEESVPEKPTLTSKPKPPPKPPSPMLSAFRPIKGPIAKPQIGSSSSMFAPVAVKPETKPAMPSAFTSTATHFKPIVLHKTESSSPTPAEEKKTKTEVVKDGDNDKEVVRKLKELKKNLMKHRQPVKETDADEKENQKEQPVISKSSSDVKRDLAEGDVKVKASNPGSLDTLLSELQKQGNAPDTESLAAAIAQHLAKNLHGAQQTSSGQDLSQGPVPGRQGPMSAATGPHMNQMFNMHLNQHMANFPPQYQQQLMGQTMTLPSLGQFGGAMMPQYPMQVQLQQDPRTGLFQIVPVGMVTVNSAPGSQANSDEFTNMEDSTRMSDPGRSPKPRPRRSGHEASRNSPTSLPKQKQGRHGRTAKDLVQKTANIRSKNLQQQNMPSISSLSGQKEYDSKQWSSTQDSEKHSSQSKAFNGDGEPSPGQYNSLPRRRSNPHMNAGDYLLHPQSQKIRSNTSSPSPSKDSGVSGLNGVYKPPDPGSLMERLLNSNTSLTLQQKMGRLVHLLREEFAFDGYMENGVEDINMAEYVMSLGSLKWETFSSAITEKYSDMYWKVDLLVSLFEAVNGIKPAILNQSSMPNRNSMQPNDTSSLKGSRYKHPDDPDGSSSSMSEANQEHPYRKQRPDKAFSNRAGDRLGSRPQSVNVIQGNYDTSDSTDNENIENRRRHRRKHFEKAKSSSMHNLASNAPTFSVASEGDNDFPRDNNAQMVYAEDQNTHNTNRRSSLPQNGLSPNNSFHSSSGASPSGSQPNHLSDSLSRQKFTSGSESPHLIQVQSQKADLSKHYRKNRGMTEGSLSSRSSSMSDVRGGPGKLTRHMSQLSLSEEKQETLTPFRRNHILFHYAMMQLSMSKDLEKFLQDIDEENAERLQAQLTSLDQQIMMERRTKRKTQVFFNRISDSQKTAKDQKTTVSKDLEEMGQKIRFLQLCRTHIEMLQTELDSINSTFLVSLSAEVADGPLRLKPQCDNPLLQLQTHREPQTGCEIHMVQAGAVEGLVSYLFASTALSFGYVHQFFLGFRYFIHPGTLMDFLTSRFAAISRSKMRETNLQRIQRRVVDLLHFWVEGFYPIDFEDNEDLVNSLQFFLEEQNIASFSEEGKKLQELLALCMEGNSRDLLTSVVVGENVHVYKQNGSAKKWDSLKTVTSSKSASKDPACMKSGFSVCLERRRNSHHMEEVYFPKTARRTDAFTLADYTSQCVAEQLTLIEQGIFQMTHPVHYLNSKALGVSVALTMSGARTPSILRLNTVEEAGVPGGNSLFVCDISDDQAIQRMIDHSRDISHWVAAEIVSCSSSKSQVAVLSKFLHAAQLCKEMRNYATCMAIADGLENIIIKQLPAWKNLPSKSYAVMEDLKSVRMFLKNDAMSLMKHADSHLYPTIPSALLFLLHVQQQEIGSFKLANDMVKWSKIRSITQTVDQIRIFKDQMYGFEPDFEMQDTLMQRVREFSSQDIQTIASQHDTNYHKMPSGGGIGKAFRKMKGKFQSK